MPSASDRTFLLGGDLPVTRIGYGAMRLTGAGLWGPYEDHEAGLRTLRGVVDAGVTLIDTADAYGPHSNELLIREALAPYPTDLVIATKGGFVRGAPGLGNISAIGHPDYLRQSVRMSLRRLGLERIDLYYLHSGHAQDAPFEEQIRTLAELRELGLIRHIGLSNLSVEQLETAQAIVPISAVTAHYNIADRTNQPLVDATLSSGAAFVPWQPVSLVAPGDAINTGGEGRIRQVLEPLAEELGATMPQVSLAWLLAQGPGVLPIPATTSLDHLRENLAAFDLTLNADHLATMDELGTR